MNDGIKIMQFKNNESSINNDSNIIKVVIDGKEYKSKEINYFMNGAFQEQVLFNNDKNSYEAFNVDSPSTLKNQIMDEACHPHDFMRKHIEKMERAFDHGSSKVNYSSIEKLRKKYNALNKENPGIVVPVRGGFGFVDTDGYLVLNMAKDVVNGKEPKESSDNTELKNMYRDILRDKDTYKNLNIKKYGLITIAALTGIILISEFSAVATDPEIMAAMGLKIAAMPTFLASVNGIMSINDRRKARRSDRVQESDVQGNDLADEMYSLPSAKKEKFTFINVDEPLPRTR